MSELTLLLQRYRANFETVLEGLPTLRALLQATPELDAELTRLWSASDYAADICIEQPALLQDLLQSGELEQPLHKVDEHLAGTLQRLCPEGQGCPPDKRREQLKRELRLYRKREMLRIMWRDISGRASLADTCRELSLLADACIHHALAALTPLVQGMHGLPLDSAGNVQELIILAMGKYGAFELNLSSDIDLIFVFPENGETTVPDSLKERSPQARAVTVQQYFSKLGQMLIAALDAVTADGHVFRVDMRLRPYGNGGALALSITAMEAYYQTQGRAWERFAMIKARAVCGNPRAVEDLQSMLRSFTYRRYIDFATIDSLRDLKHQIEQQVRRKGMHDNIKLGRGGIREIEFIVQVLQLVFGGRHRHLQQRSLFAAMDGLVLEHCMPPEDAEALKRAYTLLRRVEHAAQALQDKQTHDYPREALARQRMAGNLGYASATQLEVELEQQRDIVAALFSKVIAEPKKEGAAAVDEEWRQLWIGTLDKDKASALLASQGYLEPEAVLDALDHYRAGRQYLAMDAISRTRMERFIPQLLIRLGQEAQPDFGFRRVFEFVQAVARRTVYLVLLLENPLALSQLIMLCSASPWILELLSRYPVLLDELLRPLAEPPEKRVLQDRLHQALLRSSGNDLDEQLASIQNFKQEQVLIVAAAELSGTLPLMKVSDSLTWVAEVILERILDMAWEQLLKKYGKPFNADGTCERRDFLIIAYGKLGGIELSYGSDLDLVFMHNGHADLETTGGEGGTTVNSGAFYVRLGQKVLSLLNTHTVAGKLYDIDLRLRPSGASGALVSTPEAFRLYQRDHAWTWEHQALIRTRAVAGEAAVEALFLSIRSEVLGQQRLQQQLASDIVSMRARMRKELGSRKSVDQFHLKQDPGGLVDIEFMVQYLVLANAHHYPDLLQWSDNMRLLDLIASHDLLPADEAQALQQTYIAYRGLLHKRALDNADDRLAGGEFVQEREAVVGIWQKLFAGIEPGPLHEGGGGPEAS